jgi:hypothetical protein
VVIVNGDVLSLIRSRHHCIAAICLADGRIFYVTST